MISVLQSAVAVVFTLGIVILLHEFGHFLMCRRLGVRVERFAFGFGPELFGVTKGGTRYSLCVFPLGGFVKPAGESIEDCKGDPDEFFSQRWTGRLAIVAAGPIMNYFLAFALFSGLIYFKGIPDVGTAARVGDMLEGFPAQRAGMQVGDLITSVDGQKVADWNSLAAMIHKKPETEVVLTFERGERSFTRRITPARHSTGEGRIGIAPEIVVLKLGLLGALEEGAWRCVQVTAMTVRSIVSKLHKHERPDLAGPVGIVQMVSRAAHSGIEYLIQLIGLISVAIGFFNLLPIPLLDGGHAAFFVWEGVSGRKLTSKAMAAANGVGIFFLLSLLVFATYNDITRILGDRSARKAAVEAAEKP